MTNKINNVRLICFLTAAMSISMRAGPAIAESGVEAVWEVDRLTVYQYELFTLTLRVTHPRSVELTQLRISGLPPTDRVSLTSFESLSPSLERDLDRIVIRYQSRAEIEQPGKVSIEPHLDFIAIERRIRGYFQTEYQETAGWVQVPELILNVRELPAEGRPPQFQDAVGRFEMTSALETHNRITPGALLTLRSTISGKGNLERVREPQFASQPSETWRIYDARTIFMNHSRRIFERTVIPLSSGEKKMPPLTFAFFDPWLEQYSVLSNTLPGVRVAAPKEGELRLKPAVAERPDILPLKPRLQDQGRLAARLQSRISGWIWWAPMLVITAALLLKRLV